MGGKARSFVLDVLFPRRCPWCDKVIGFSPACACEKELKTVCFPEGPVDLAPRGENCAQLREAWACFYYEDPVKAALHRLKFEDQAWLARPLGGVLARRFAESGLAGRYDAVVPVPVSAKTRRERGYNQSTLMARVVARAGGLPLLEGALHKTRETRRQMDLRREERIENVKGAYTVPEAGAVRGQRLLLVDDVLTTGSTLNECARALRAAGAAECGALCLTTVEIGDV